MIAFVQFRHIKNFKSSIIAKIQIGDEEWDDAGKDWKKRAEELLGPTCEWFHCKRELFGGYYRNENGDCLIME